MPTYPLSDFYARPLRPEEQPRVSVITPVYNGEEFLSECIESVLAQSYQNWDYTIVNNCSTDRTLEIAQSYAARDPRIRVHNNDVCLMIVQNHNHAIRQISSESRYCKVVFADDWLFPECLMAMVNIAESYPSVGIVGSYGLDGTNVLWSGLPYPGACVSGRKLCRELLLGGPYVLGTPTSLLVRSDLIRAREHFYNEANLHADYEVCYDCLQSTDFGFVHQILTYSRPRAESNTASAMDLESYALGYLSALMTYGPIYLSPTEYEIRLKQKLKEYYKILAKSFLRLRDETFWEYHRNRLQVLGHPLNDARLVRAVLRELVESMLRPAGVVNGILTWWPRAFHRRRVNAGAQPVTMSVGQRKEKAT